MKPPTGNPITQGSHLVSKAVDYSARPDPLVYAPEDMTFDSYQVRGTGTNAAGNCLRGKGKTGLHQFAHLERTYWKSGKVKKGQKIAKMGHTGFTRPSGVGGTHLHYWVLTPKGYVYPPKLYTEPFKEDDVYKGKSAKEHYLEAKAWKARAEKLAAKVKQLEAGSKFKTLADKVKALIPFTK